MTATESWNEGGPPAIMVPESDDDVLLAGMESSADIDYGRGRQRKPSFISRLSFRTKSHKEKRTFDAEDTIDEDGPGGGNFVRQSTSTRNTMYAKESNEELRTRAELRRMVTRKGRHNPFQTVHRMVMDYFYTDEETIAMEQQSTRQKLMNYEVRSLDVFDRLRAVYKVPTASKTYDTTTPYRLLFRSDNVLKLALMRMDFWVLMLFHTLVVVFYGKYVGVFSESQLGPDQGPAKTTNWPRVPASMVEIAGGLLSVLFTFYNNQSYNRFMEQYWHCQRQLGAISESVLLLRVLVPDNLFEGAKEVRTELWHLIHATHLLGYTGLPQQRAQDIDRWSWLYAHERELLNKDQIQRLKPLLNVGAGNQPFKDTINWIMTRYRELEKKGYITPAASANLCTRLWTFRGNIDVLYGMVFQPIPFAYFHLANTTLIMYLLVLSYSFAFEAPYFSILGYAMIVLSYTGLRELSSALADPFGADDTDIPVFDAVDAMHKNMSALIHLPITANPDHVPLPPLDQRLQQETAQSSKQARGEQRTSTG